jgi:hypothetical protein
MILGAGLRKTALEALTAASLLVASGVNAYAQASSNQRRTSSCS